MPSTPNKKLKRNTVIFLAVCCLAMLAAFVITDHPAPPDPIYKGQPLSKWLSMVGMRLHDWEWEEIGATPSEALQAIGTNALPLIISELRVRDSRPRIWLQETLMENQLDDHWMRRPAWYRHGQALEACVALGTNSVSVVPVIAELLSSEVQLYTRYGAAWCLESLGTNAWAAIPALERAVKEKSLVIVESGQTNDYAAKALVAVRGVVSKLDGSNLSETNAP